MNFQSMTKIKILIIDDHTLFNDGLASLLRQEELIEIKGQIYDSNQALDAIYKTVPDLVLLDFNMPKTNGLELAKLIFKNLPSQKILILSMYGDVRFIDAFRKAGVHGYILKTAAVKELIYAIQTIMEGGAYYDPKITLLKTRNDPPEDNFLKKHKLTRKELEVLKLIKSGFKNSEIAEQLSIALYTVETHRKNIYFKLQIRGTAELHKWLLENDL